jgi:hypothetical protein
MTSDRKEPEFTTTTRLSGFIHGHEYRLMNQSQKESYVTGVLDGLMVAFAMTKQTSSQQWLEECIQGVPVNQLTAFVTTYITTNPESSQATANELVFNALVSLSNK